ncbi:unnamed protein product [Rotaria sp. Silwood1]|nr:unnamed protein product [Rotaria sp. Silwood1]
MNASITATTTTTTAIITTTTTTTTAIITTTTTTTTAIITTTTATTACKSLLLQILPLLCLVFHIDFLDIE